MKKQHNTEPGRKLTVLRTSELLRILGGTGVLVSGGGGGAPQYGGPTTPTPPTMR